MTNFFDKAFIAVAIVVLALSYGLAAPEGQLAPAVSVQAQAPLDAADPIDSNATLSRH